MNNIFLLISCITALSLSAQNKLNIVPMPASAELPASAGTMILTKNTPLVLEGSGLEKTAAFFNNYLQKYYGFKLPVTRKAGAKNAIVLNYERLDNEIPGAYTLEVNKKGVYIAGDNEAGAFYGIQTLIQLLPTGKKTNLAIPYVKINDQYQHHRCRLRGEADRRFSRRFLLS